jgi:hypothetical protein
MPYICKVKLISLRVKAFSLGRGPGGWQMRRIDPEKAMLHRETADELPGA